MIHKHDHYVDANVCGQEGEGSLRWSDASCQACREKQPFTAKDAHGFARRLMDATKNDNPKPTASDGERGK